MPVQGLILSVWCSLSKHLLLITDLEAVMSQSIEIFFFCPIFYSLKVSCSFVIYEQLCNLSGGSFAQSEVIDI